MAKSPKNKLKKELINLSDEVLRIFRASKNDKSYNYKEIAAKLRITDEMGRAMVQQVVEKLFAQETLEEMRPGSYRLRKKEETVEGKVSITAKGFGFLITEEGEDDLFIPESKLNNALPNDTVRVKVKKGRGGSGKREAEVVEIVSRFREFFVGVVALTDQYAFVTPDSKDMGIDFLVARDKLMGAKHGQKVIVKLIDWPAHRDNPNGEITEILGSPGDHDTEMMSITAEFGFPLQFPPEVIAQAEKLTRPKSPNDATSGASPPSPLTQMMPRILTMPCRWNTSKMAIMRLVSTLPMFRTTLRLGVRSTKKPFAEPHRCIW